MSNKGKGIKGDTVLKIVRLIKMFMDGARLTRMDIAERLDVSIPTAHRYLECLSLEFPIIEVNDCRPFRFAMMEDK